MRKSRRLQSKTKKGDKSYKAGSFGLGNNPEAALERKNRTEPAHKKRNRDSGASAEPTTSTVSSELPTSSDMELTFVAAEEVVVLASF